MQPGLAANDPLKAFDCKQEPVGGPDHRRAHRALFAIFYLGNQFNEPVLVLLIGVIKMVGKHCLPDRSFLDRDH